MPVADAEPVFRCAYRLEQVAEDVRTAAARTAGAYPSDWHGTAGIAYQQRLDATADRVRRAAAAYDAAGAALVPYARALLDAAALEQRAHGLLADAADADRRAAAAAALGVAGPSAAGGFRAAASRLQAEAAEVERRAAAICAAALHDEAERAPAPSGWQQADRFAGDLMQYGAGTVAGTFSLLGSAWHALPGVGSRHSRHEARSELAESAGAAAQIWNIPIDIRNAVQDGRPGLAAGPVLSALVPETRLGRFPIRDVRLAHLEAFREAAVRAEIAGHLVHVDTAASMGTAGVEVINQEARGGHTKVKHIGAADEYLFARNDNGTRRAGTFLDVEQAERFVNQVLRRNEDRVDEVYTLGKPLRLVERFDEPTGRVAVAGERRTVVAYAVRVVLKLEDGEPYVFTAFPEL